MGRRSLQTRDRKLGDGVRDVRARQTKPKQVRRSDETVIQQAEQNVAWEIAQLLRRTGPLALETIAQRTFFSTFTLRMGLKAKPEWFVCVDELVSLSAAYLELQRESMR